jgi:YD repeat-containing protein
LNASQVILIFAAMESNAYSRAAERSEVENATANTTGSSVPINPRNNRNKNQSFSVLDGASNSTPSIPLATVTTPKSGGAISSIGEKFTTEIATGTAKLTVPIATTNIDGSRGAMVPIVSLSYNSGSGNGIFGYGWQVSTGSINRKTDLGLPQYLDDIPDIPPEEQDIFILSGAEDLVPELNYSTANGAWVASSPEIQTVNGVQYAVHQYRPRVENVIQRVERWTTTDSTRDTHWRTISGDNVTSIYGLESASRITNASDNSRVFSWLLCSVQDDRGSRYEIDYKSEDSVGINNTQANEFNRTDQTRAVNRYPKRIRYGNVTSTLSTSWQENSTEPQNWLFQIVFDYGEHDLVNPTPVEKNKWQVRADPFSNYRAGFEVRTYRLCQRVLMFHNFPDEPGVGTDCLVKSTNLIYTDVRGANTASNMGDSLATFLESVTVCNYLRNGSTYNSAFLPPVQFTYSYATIDDTIRELNPENLPLGIDEDIYKFVDLNGEGVAGVLSQTTDGQAWMYKPPLGGGRFEHVEILPFKPNSARLGEGQRLMDLERDGSLDVVQLDQGYSRRTWEHRHPVWLPFRRFESIPKIDWNDDNLRFLDLTGNGQADILITEDEVLTFYSSLGPRGYSSAKRVLGARDDEAGPRLIFADPLHCIFLADMSGDGLVDLVRIRQGEVSYWPNEGYGRFGAKVSMDNAPWLDTPDQWESSRVRLADLDGNGVSDIIYLNARSVSIYRNQSGNSWTKPQLLNNFPMCDNLSKVQVADLFGNGTACLLWSSSILPDGQTMKYVDLMGAKPNLLVSYINNLGTETKLHYASSTKFYLQDKAANTPWITRIPFPVQVVEHVETSDHIGRTYHSCRYVYHHGYYDGLEREFRGFGMVEQYDTEHFDVLDDKLASIAVNLSPESSVPPMLTKTWFHTGLWEGDGRISKFFEDEYWKEPGGLSTQQQVRMQLPDTQLPTVTISPDGTTHPYALHPLEAFEACRALRGSMLRQEIYGLDGTNKEPIPYSVAENNFLLNLFQPRADFNRHAVFMKLPSESITFHYERYTLQILNTQMICSPEVSHDVKLAYDTFGNLLKSVTITYGQRYPDPDAQGILTPADTAKQTAMTITYQEHDYTNSIDEDDIHRNPLHSESRGYEIFGVHSAGIDPMITNLFSLAGIQTQVVKASDGSHDLPFENWEGTGIPAGTPYRRLIEQSRTIYLKDDLSAPLALGVLESRALPFQSYRLSYTPDLLSDVFITSGKVASASELQSIMTENGYVSSEGDTNWWIPSGTIFYSPNATDTAAQELQYALEHFFIPQRYRDPFYASTFNTESTIEYDKYALLPLESVTPLGNRTTAGQRDLVSNALLVNGLDYRLLTSTTVMSPNQNVTAFAFDILGMLVGTALMGKPGENLGDSLQGFVPDLSPTTIATYFQDPAGQGLGLLGNATSRSIYNVLAYYQTKTQINPSPAMVASISREVHLSDLAPGASSRVQQSISYSDGFERIIQLKAQTDPGPVPQRDSSGQIILGPNGLPLMTTNSVDPRWVCSGWTVFNNKNLPVRTYEPFFTDLSAFEFDVKIGVSPIVSYDPANRPIMTLNPDCTWSKVVFDPWRQESWDLNDTVLVANPTTDPDVGGYFARLPSDDYLPTWYAARQTGGEGLQQQECAQKTAVHANTPLVDHFDPLGRRFLTVQDNRFMYGDGSPATEAFYTSRVDYDIQNNVRRRFDSLGRQVSNDVFGILTQLINSSNMDSGQRWILPDILGNVRYQWDDRGYRFHHVFDELRRPLQTFQRLNNGTEILLEKYVYGESQPSPETNNNRLQVVQAYDQAGSVVSDAHDFKGNILSQTRTLVNDYWEYLDWSGSVATDESFATSSIFDALNRTTTSTLPDSTIVRFTYNLENRLNGESANIRDSSNATTYVSNIAYNAKGQRLSISYGNGTTKTYSYDPLTNRLTQMLTQRNSQEFPNDCPQPPLAGWAGCQIQNLSYTNDPMGNVTNIADAAQQSIFFRNKKVDPSNDYIYDAIYRLIEATGREHLGQTNGVMNQPAAPGPFDGFAGLPNPNDGNAMATYTERYSYDSVGNILTLKHVGSDPVSPGWTKTYSYQEPSQLQSTDFSNRLSSTAVGTTSQTYGYDSDAGLHGDITSMPHLSAMAWDSRDQLRSTSKQIVTNGGTPETTFYVYDMKGERVRKVTNYYAVPGATASRKSQTVYVGAFEVYTRYGTSGAAMLTRNTVHIQTGDETIALVETEVKGELTTETTRINFQIRSVQLH